MINRTSTVTKLIMKLRYAAEYDDLVLTEQNTLMLEAAKMLEALNDQINELEFELDAFIKFESKF